MTSTITPRTDRRAGNGESGSESYARTGDEELARAVQRDTGAFTELYRRYFNRVYGYHLLRTSNVQDAQDLTSQTFIAALESIQRFDGRGSFAAWLMGIAHNKMAMFYRGLRPTASLSAAENLPGSGPQSGPQSGAQMEDMAHQRGLLRRISGALRQMTSDRAEAFVLRTLGGLSAAEAAAVLGKSEGSVKMLVYRALQDIRQKLDAERSTEELQ